MVTDAGGGPPSSGSSLAALVRTWRERALLTQEQLARRTGLGVRTIRRLESHSLRRPRSESLRLLADVLKLTDAERTQLIAAARGRPARHVPAAGRLARQLPADVTGFTGRADHLRRLDALLSGDGPPAAVVISAIAGTAGVGKTALAVHWAHRVADRFADGQLYVNLRGLHPGGTPTAPAIALRGFLEALEVPSHRVPAGLDAQAALYRSLLADRRMLIVLDNANDAEQVRPLLPGTSGCLTVVTSRHQLTGLAATEGARLLVLDLMSTVESRELLARRLGADRVTAEPDAVEDIIAACARLPLALAVAAARAATHPDLTLAALAAELRDERGRLDAFATEDAATDMRAVFSWSYRRLGAPAARQFRLLGLHPGPDISAPAAASLAGVPPGEVRPLLAELTRAQLVVEPAPGRYTCHDLLRAYASELARAVDTDDEREAALCRLLDHYLHTALDAQPRLWVWRDPITAAPPSPGVTPERFPTDDDMLAWLDAERPVLLAAIDRAASSGLDTYAWQLAWVLLPYFERRGLWSEWATTQAAALTAAQRLADRPRQARAHRGLGLAYARLSRYDEAHAQLGQALDLYGALGDRVGQAHTHDGFTWALLLQGEYKAALRHARQALDLYDREGNPAAQANALNNMGWCCVELGDHCQALVHCERALTLFRELGDRNGAAATWDSLGQAHRQLGHYDRTVASFLHALAMRRDLGNRLYEAATLARLGDTHHASGDPGAARDAWQRALDILADFDHADAERVRAKINDLDRSG